MSDAGAERRSAAGDLAAGIVLFSLSAVGAWSISANKFIIGVDYGNDPGPGLLPAILLVLLALSSIAMMALAGLKLLRRRDGGTETGPSGKAGTTLLVPALMVVTLLVYAQSMTWLGFLETTATFAVFWTIAIGVQDFGRPDGRRVAIWLLEAAAICFGIYAVFAWLIKIPLP
jgi:hypothetical protein